jgi:hypothetical protein
MDPLHASRRRLTADEFDWISGRAVGLATRLGISITPENEDAIGAIRFELLDVYIVATGIAAISFGRVTQIPPPFPPEGRNQ